MSFTITPGSTPDTIYFVLCIVLMILQVIQYASLRKSKSEVEQIWSQIAIMAAVVASKMKELEEKLDKHEKNNKE